MLFMLCLFSMFIICDTFSSTMHFEWRNYFWHKRGSIIYFKIIFSFFLLIFILFINMCINIIQKWYVLCCDMDKSNITFFMRAVFSYYNCIRNKEYGQHISWTTHVAMKSRIFLQVWSMLILKKKTLLKRIWNSLIFVKYFNILS